MVTDGARGHIQVLAETAHALYLHLEVVRSGLACSRNGARPRAGGTASAPPAVLGPLGGGWATSAHIACSWLATGLGHLGQISWEPGAEWDLPAGDTGWDFVRRGLAPLPSLLGLSWPHSCP